LKVNSAGLAGEKIPVRSGSLNVAPRKSGDARTNSPLWATPKKGPKRFNNERIRDINPQAEKGEKTN